MLARGVRTRRLRGTLENLERIAEGALAREVRVDLLALRIGRLSAQRQQRWANNFCQRLVADNTFAVAQCDRDTHVERSPGGVLADAGVDAQRKACFGVRVRQLQRRVAI